MIEMGVDDVRPMSEFEVSLPPSPIHPGELDHVERGMPAVT